MAWTTHYIMCIAPSILQKNCGNPWSFNTAKELWESLDKKYKTEDVGLKKFVMGKFLDYKMLDSKTVISQVQDLQVILHDIHEEGMSLSESFQVAAIILKIATTMERIQELPKA